MQNVNNTQYTVASIVGYYNYLKYDTLKRLTLMALKDDKRTVANVYIDLYKVFLDIYGRNLSIGPDKKVLSSLVINLCAHMRGFYRMYGIHTNFFLVYSDISTGFNKLYFPEYNLNNELRIKADAKMQDLVDVNIGLLDVLVPYLPDIYLIKGHVEPAVIMYDLICKEEALHNNYNPNIILSRDPMTYQIPSVHKDSYLFRCNKKYATEFVTGYLNAYHGYLSIDSKRANILQNEAILNKLLAISPELLGLLISITNLPSRYVKSLVDLPKAISYIYGAVTRNAIPNCHNSDLDLLYYNIFDHKGGIYKIAKEEFEIRYRSIDLLSQFVDYTTMIESQDMSYYTNLIDVEMVQHINNTEFTDCPLDLNNL